MEEDSKLTAIEGMYLPLKDDGSIDDSIPTPSDEPEAEPKV